MGHAGRAWIAVMGITVLVWAVAPATADIYQYIDSKGVWHFTNVRTSAKYKLFMRDGQRVAAKYIADYGPIIDRAARHYGLSPALIKAVIKAESNFNHRAVSEKGAQGLMQLMPPTADDLDVSNPFDPEENIFGGVRYLSDLFKRFNNDPVLALAAYNAGPERVVSCQGVPPIKETRDFIERVRTYYSRYRDTGK